MRDYLILAIVLGSVPLAVVRPYLGILSWSWVAYMNPHRLTWSIAYNFPVAQAIAAGILLGLPFTKDRSPIPREREVGLLIALWGLFTVTTLLAEYPEDAWWKWQIVSKIMLMTFVTLVLFAERRRLRWLLLVIALSIGFYGFKGGLFGVATGGQYRVYGPEGTFIGDNNDFALAALIALPLLFYLAAETKDRRGALFLRVTGALTAVSVILTYSRGGFVGLAVLSVFGVLKSRRKLLSSVALLLAVGLMLTVTPKAWFERMETISEYEQESSARGRLNAWHFAANLAMSRPLTGGGFEAFSPELFERYAPEPLDFHDAHSIYFEMLGEHGFLGLGLFLALLLLTLSSLRRLKKQTRGEPSLAWVQGYSEMLQMSLVAYMVSGAFLGRAYFDLAYHLIAIAIVVKVVAKRQLQTLAATASAGAENPEETALRARFGPRPLGAPA